jgi:hypothetical protein
MAQSGFVLPLNDVVQGDYLTERLEIGEGADITKMLPGRHVIRDTSDYGVAEGGAAGLVIGILGYGEANADYKPATRDTAYTALGDEVPVHNGTFRARVYVTETVLKGQPLVAAVDGKFEKADAATVKVTGGSTINTDGVVNGSSGVQGAILGRAAEGITGAGKIWAVMSI